MYSNVVEVVDAVQGANVGQKPTVGPGWEDVCLPNRGINAKLNPKTDPLYRTKS